MLILGDFQGLLLTNRVLIQAQGPWTDDELQSEFAKVIPLPPRRYRQCPGSSQRLFVEFWMSFKVRLGRPHDLPVRDNTTNALLAQLLLDCLLGREPSQDFDGSHCVRQDQITKNISTSTKRN